MTELNPVVSAAAGEKHIHVTAAFGPKAIMVSNLLAGWGTSTRSPKDMVKRAIDVADEAFSAFEARGWIVAIPAPAEDTAEA